MPALSVLGFIRVLNELPVDEDCGRLCFTYSLTASPCFAQIVTLCQSVSVVPSCRYRSVASLSWVTAVPFGV